jgi:hypothetical protein
VTLLRLKPEASSITASSQDECKRIPCLGINIVIGDGFILLALFGAGKFFEKAKQYLPFFG